MSARSLSLTALALMLVTASGQAATRPLESAMPSSSGPPVVDSVLGERLQPREQAMTEAIASALEASIRERYAAGAALRDAHPKAHGCVHAELKVAETLPEALAHGIFVPGRRYRAWLRFSNGSSDATRPDGKKDARGLAMKVLDVPGPKLLAAEADARTQDFIFINHPVFFANDPERYLAFVQAAAREGVLAKLGIPFALGIKGTRIALQTTRHEMSNPLQARYWTMVPYQLGEGPGRQAVKYSIRACASQRDPMPANPGPDFLRDAMRATLQAGDACMELLVQPRTSAKMDVEDSMTEWPEADAPFVRIATVRIPRQDFDTPAQNEFCENLSFTPWHSLPAHRPLGVTNRIRRVVYERISELRHAMNAAPRVEPE